MIEALLPLLLQEKQKKQAEAANKISLSKIGQDLGPIGDILQNIAVTNDGNSNVGMSTIGGAISGAGKGAAAGPFGAILGALMGGTSGYAAANKDNAEFFDYEKLRKEYELLDKSIDPNIGIYGKGGLMEMTPVQMDKGEFYADEAMNIFESKSKAKHEDMDDDDVTDLIVKKSFAFSDRLTFKPYDYKDTVLGYNPGYYSEGENGGVDLVEVKFSDVFGDSKKEITFSEAAKILKKAYPTYKDGDADADVLTKITNDENKTARASYLNTLIKIQQGLSTPSEETIKPKKFATGGSIIPGMDMATFLNMLKTANNNLNGLPQTTQMQDVGGLPMADLLGSKQVIGSVPTDSGLNYKPLPSISVDDLNKPNKDVSKSPLDMFSSINNQLEELKTRNAKNFDAGKSAISDLGDRMRTRSGLSAIMNGLAIGLQDSRVNPDIVSTRFAGDMYQELPSAVTDAISSNNFAKASSVISALATTNPEAAGQVAPRLFDSALAQSNDAQIKAAIDNLKTKRGKYEFLNRAGTANIAAKNKADQATADLLNAKRAAIASNVTDYLGNMNTIDTGMFGFNRANEAQYNANDMKLTEYGMGLDTQKFKSGVLAKDREARLKALMDLLGIGASSKQTQTPKSLSNPYFSPYVESVMSQPVYDLPLEKTYLS